MLYNDRVSLRSVTGYNELHNGFFKILITRLPWSGEAWRLTGPRGRVESPGLNDHEGSATHGIKY